MGSIGSRSGYWSGFTKAACAPSSASDGETTCRTKKCSRELACPAQSPSASGAAALGWLRRKNGRRTHAQSSLLQPAPRRKERSCCSKKALQTSAEETACTGGDQPSVMAAGGLRPIRPRQLALISEIAASSRWRDIKPQRKNAGGKKSEHPIHPHPKPSSVRSAVGVVHQESVSTATNEHARIDNKPSQQFWSARNEPSSLRSRHALSQDLKKKKKKVAVEFAAVVLQIT